MYFDPAFSENPKGHCSTRGKGGNGTSRFNGQGGLGESYGAGLEEARGALGEV